MRQSGTIEMHGEDEKTFEVQDPKLCKEDPATASLNPWSLRCHREQLAKMRSGKSNGVHSILSRSYCCNTLVNDFDKSRCGLKVT